VIIIDANTIHEHTAMMIVFHATAIAGRAVMHTGELVYFAEITEAQLTVVAHLIVDDVCWLE